MLFYYAHSKKDYDSAKESGVVARLIRRKHDVINPKYMGELGSIKPYLVKVNKSEGVVVTEYHGYIGRGVYEEVKYALYLGRPVYLVEPNRIKAVVITGAKIYDPEDWAYRYAQLVKSNLEVVL